MMKLHQLKRSLSGLGAFTLATGLIMQVAFPGGIAFAATQPITPRSLTLKSTGLVANDIDGDGIADGGSMPGATVNHLFNFTVHNSAAQLGSITFQYCTTGEPVTSGIGCEAPDGLDVSGATLAADGGDITGFTGLTTSSVDDASDGKVNTITISLAAPTAVSDSALSKEFTGIVNPTTTNQTFYVRISTYTSLDGTGTVNDAGTVAASTANPIYLSGTMPESLIFCTGHDISETNNVPDCSRASAGDIFFNQLFSSTSTAWATSQMAASTNAGTGYAITVNGPTLASGSNQITALGTGDVSKPGTSQFGMNLVADDDANAATPAITPSSAAVTSPTGNTFYHGQPVAPYATGGDASTATYAYATGDTVANSNSLASDPQVFTATYMVNVPGHQPAGTYATTLTYICTATF